MGRELTAERALELCVEQRERMLYLKESKEEAAKYLMKKYPDSIQDLCPLCDYDGIEECKKCPIKITTGVTCCLHSDDYHYFDPEGGLEFALSIQAAWEDYREGLEETSKLVP